MCIRRGNVLEQYYGLEKETIYTIGEFSILWCYFEQSIFNSEANPFKMLNWAKKRELSSELIALCENIKEKAIIYLNGIDDATIETRIYSVNRPPNDEHRKLISDFLEGDTDNPLLGCTLFILRIRNNMFHGLKDIFTLNKQREMFLSINEFLQFILKIY